MGWGNNVHVNLNTHGLGSSLALSHARHATLWDLLLHLHRHNMLRSGIFSCTCTHTSCYALGSSLALSHARHATLWDLLLHLHTHESCSNFVGINLSLLLICPPHIFLGVCLSSSKFPFSCFPSFSTWIRSSVVSMTTLQLCPQPSDFPCRFGLATL